MLCRVILENCHDTQWENAILFKHFCDKLGGTGPFGKARKEGFKKQNPKTPRCKIQLKCSCMSVLSQQHLPWDSEPIVLPPVSYLTWYFFPFEGTEV
jgi:hypothetical protein